MINPFLILAVVLGLAIGSFLNVIIYRLPRNKPFWRGRSACPKCDNQLKWYHNIPLVSYLALRGKCGFCHEPISFRYPAVELTNALVYALAYWQYGPTIEFGVLAYLGSALIAVFLIDLEFQIIPDSITLSGIGLGLALSFAPGGIGIVPAIIGVAVGGGSLFAVAMLGDWLFKKESMGGGDIKLAAMLGAFLGWAKILFVFVASAAIGIVGSIILMSLSSEARKTRAVPFGPFIAMAAGVAIVYGDQIIAFYVENFLPH